MWVEIPAQAIFKNICKMDMSAYKGDLNAFKFESVKSTAQSMLLIGCSGYGKTTSLIRTLSAYPQVIYHRNFNIEQVVYLKIDCSHNGSLKRSV